MDNTTQPVKPAIVPTDTRTILSIGSRDYQLDQRIDLESAIWMMRLLSLGTSPLERDFDKDTGRMVDTIGPREVIALALTPAGSEVAK